MADTATITKIVNSFASALVGVCKNLGISAVLDKSEISPETKAPNNRAAALIGFVTSTVNGTIGLLADEQAFGEIVTTMSGGAVNPDFNDSLVMSAFGELTNMISGQAFIKFNEKEISITPPQLLTGEFIVAVPSAEDAVRSFTIPFKLDTGSKLYLVLALNA